jgi:integrase/recombinase XerD
MDAREIDAFIAWIRTSKNRKPSTQERYKYELMRFERFLGNQKEPRKIWDATDTDIHRFLSEVGKDVAKTRETRWHAIMQYFKYLLEKDLIKENPAAAIAMAKAPRRSTSLSVLSRDEVTRLLSAPGGHVDKRDNPTRDKAILYALYSGLKMDECRTLLLRDVNLAKRQIGVDGRKLPLALTQEAADAIAAYLAVRPKKKEPALFLGREGFLSKRHIAAIVTKMARACHLDRRPSPETLRASFALHGIENRVGFVELIDALGKIDRPWLQQLVDIARPRMEAASVGLPASRVYPAKVATTFMSTSPGKSARRKLPYLLSVLI